MEDIPQYLLRYVFTWSAAAQLAVGVITFLLAHRAAGAIRSRFERQMALSALSQESSDLRKARTFLKAARPMISVLLLGIAFRLANYFNWPSECLEVLLTLALGLFLTRFLAGPIMNRYWAGILTAIIWMWVMLRVFHFVEIGTNFLNSIDFAVGSVRVSVLTISRAIFFSLVLYWFARNLLITFRIWLLTASNLPPATQTLLHKLCAIFLFSASVLFILHYMKIDLTLFALFGGAMGLGIGFGLQKVFANLVSGFMILADKSIKPGDVIQLGNTYGWINFLGSRYVSVITRNGIEHLIPNEQLVTGEVINWSYSSNLVRLQVQAGIAYDSDLPAAVNLMLEAAADPVRVLREPGPTCLVTSFGDNAINLELRVWINDPQNGIAAVRSEILMGIWRRFKENGIEMPYPQRVLHLKSMPEVRILTELENREAA
jgi:small-conductance mechanosensitive channel